MNSQLREEFELQAHNLLQLTKQQGPRVDLRSIARARKVTVEVRSGRIGHETGQLFPELEGFRAIIYDPPHLSGRWRFTLAHEIGHTFFFDSECSPPTRLSTWNPDEESICDIFAAALLMPKAFVEPLFEKPKQESFLKKLNSAALKLDVTHHAMARRIARDFQQWKGIILCCRWRSITTLKGNESDWTWRIEWGVVSPELDGYIFIPQRTKKQKNTPGLRWNALNNQLAEHQTHGQFQINLEDLRKPINIAHSLQAALNIDLQEASVEYLYLGSGQNLFESIAPRGQILLALGFDQFALQTI
jgi:IrrE N-terminal-like domain